MLDLYHKRRIEAFNFLGNMCAYCGATGNLEIDHRDWREKSFSVAKLWSIKREKFEAELRKCQALCKDCHATKTKLDLREIKQARAALSPFSLTGKTAHF
jgi:hypothetical protein